MLLVEEIEVGAHFLMPAGFSLFFLPTFVVSVTASPGIASSVGLVVP
tara:strand:- start:1579 stop:1719 length:141 start_codon:yes stop_codon:yes gene_type:complete